MISKKFKNDRDVRFDAIRVISMIFIVCILHFSQYTVYSEWYRTLLADLLTKASLAAFTFISGYFSYIALKKRNGKALDYYKDRILRVYPLFVLSALSLLVTRDIKNIKELLFTCLGHFGCLTGNSPKTLWFVCMLFMFYLISPLAYRLKKRTYIIAIGIIFEGIFTAAVLFLNGDKRILLNFPFYIVGFICPSIGMAERLEKLFGKNINKIGLSVLMLVILYAIYMVKDTFKIRFFISLPLSLLFSLIMLCVVWLVVCFLNSIIKSHFYKKCVELIAYASFCMYLFHRLIYSFVSSFMGGVLPLVSSIVLSPMIFGFSFCLQVLYDNISITYKKRKASSRKNE